MTRLYVVTVALLGLAACATTVPEEPDLAYEHGRVCNYERETGSNMRVRVCRTQEEIDAARVDADRVLKEMDDSSIATTSE